MKSFLFLFFLKENFHFLFQFIKPVGGARPLDLQHVSTHETDKSWLWTQGLHVSVLLLLLFSGQFHFYSLDKLKRHKAQLSSVSSVWMNQTQRGTNREEEEKLRQHDIATLPGERQDASNMFSLTVCVVSLRF